MTPLVAEALDRGQVLELGDHMLRNVCAAAAKRRTEEVGLTQATSLRWAAGIWLLSQHWEWRVVDMVDGSARLMLVKWLGELAQGEAQAARYYPAERDTAS